MSTSKSSTNGLPVINERAAGIDIGSRFHVVACPMNPCRLFRRLPPIFIADQLNTHKSASLVTWIAEQCAVKDDLGKKGAAGILSRRLLKRGQFKSMDELKERILKFIAFFNETLAKPFR